MELKLYLDKEELSVAAYAREIGVSRQAVYSWLKGEKFPTKENISKTKARTKGKVTANDFA